MYNPSKKPLFLNGSGRLHHLSYGFVKTVADYSEEPFAVLVFDAHSDGVGSPVEPKKKDPEYPYLEHIHCGDFWSQALRDIPEFHIVIYPDEDHGRVLGHARHILGPYEAIMNSDTQLVPILLKTLKGRTARGVKGVYISIDLDCLERKYLQTDYPKEEGTTPEFLIETMEKVASKFPVIGADICGLSRRGAGRRSIQTFAEVYRSLEHILAA